MSKNLYINEFSPEPMEDETKMLEGSKYRTVGHPALARKGHRLQQKTLFRKRWFAILTTAVMMLIMAFGIVKLSSLPMGATAAPMVHEKVQSDVPSYQDGWTGGVDIDPVHVDSKIIDDQPMNFDELTVDNLGDRHNGEIKLRARRGTEIRFKASKENVMQFLEVVLGTDNIDEGLERRELLENIRKRLYGDGPENPPGPVTMSIKTKFQTNRRTGGQLLNVRFASNVNTTNRNAIVNEESPVRVESITNGQAVNNDNSTANVNPPVKIESVANGTSVTDAISTVNTNNTANQNPPVKVESTTNENLVANVQSTTQVPLTNMGGSEIGVGFNRDYNIDILSMDSQEAAWKDDLASILETKRDAMANLDVNIRSSDQFMRESNLVLIKEYCQEDPLDNRLNNFFGMTINGREYRIAEVKTPENIIPSDKKSSYITNPYLIFRDKRDVPERVWMLFNSVGIPMTTRKAFTDDERKVIVSDVVKAMVLTKKSGHTMAQIDPRHIFLTLDDSTQMVNGIKILDDGRFPRISQDGLKPAVLGSDTNFDLFLRFISFGKPTLDKRNVCYGIYVGQDEDVMIPKHIDGKFANFYLFATQRTTAEESQNVEKLLDHPFITGGPLNVLDPYAFSPTGGVFKHTGISLYTDPILNRRPRASNLQQNTIIENNIQKILPFSNAQSDENLYSLF